MSFDPLNSPLVLLAGGLVLFIAGLSNALLGPFQRHSRAAVLGLGAAAALLAVGAWRPAALGPAAAAVGAGSLLVAAVGSRRVATVAGRLQQAHVPWFALGALGPVPAGRGGANRG